MDQPAWWLRQHAIIAAAFPTENASASVPLYEEPFEASIPMEALG